ncbi:MAG: hypothetical protein P4L87_00055 [Formivibrio sp.]|nr:hypothetical protein [Formivibrio sp.]
MGKKEEYVRRMQAMLDQWHTEIDTLVVKAALAEAEAKIEYNKQLDALRSKQAATRAKLEELQSASGDAWEDMRAGVDVAWDTVNEAIRSAISRFK